MSKMADNLGLTALVGILIFTCSNSIHARTPIDLKREAIVAQIKKGQIESGLETLRQLQDQYPNNQKLLADLIITHYINGQFTTTLIPRLNHLDPKTYPSYGQLVLIRALRDLKQMALAEYYATIFLQREPSNDMQLILGIVQAEAQKPKIAAVTLMKVDLSRCTPDQRAQMAYAYRLLNQPVDALNVITPALSHQPSKFIQEQYVYVLVSNQDYEGALHFVDANRMQLTFPNIDQYIKINQFAQDIRDAIAFYKLNSETQSNSNAFAKLDNVLNELQKNEDLFSASSDYRTLFYYHQIYALNARHRYASVIEVLPKVGQSVEQMPAYIRHAVAESYLKLRRPAIAERLYKSLLNEKNYADYAVYSGLYYALIEQEKFQEANQLILTMDTQLPKFRYSAAKGVDKTTHEDRAEFLALKGLNLAYQNQNAAAEQYFQDLVAKAPNNLMYQNGLATVQRWRNKPETSQSTIAQFNGIEPLALGSVLNQMQNDQAQSNIEQWRIKNQFLQSFLPDDSGVQLSKKELEDRQHATIQHQSTWSKSRADNSQLLQNLSGTSEQEYFTQLNSPWFADNFRLYAAHHQRQAEFRAESLRAERLALGMEWQDNRKDLDLAVTHLLKENDLGLRVRWSQWLNDHWQYAIGFDSRADVPLQASERGVTGQAYAANLNWQANESYQAGVGYQSTDMTDNNLRQQLSVYYKQRIFATPHHLTHVALSQNWSRNSDVAVNYFNPSHLQSIELSFTHDWMTWRNYQRNFNQHFKFDIGAATQTDYATKPILNLMYQHDWQLSRTWRLNYGVGWSSHYYNGEREQKTYAQLGFEGRF